MVYLLFRFCIFRLSSRKELYPKNIMTCEYFAVITSLEHHIFNCTTTRSIFLKLASLKLFLWILNYWFGSTGRWPWTMGIGFNFWKLDIALRLLTCPVWVTVHFSEKKEGGILINVKIDKIFHASSWYFFFSYFSYFFMHSFYFLNWGMHYHNHKKKGMHSHASRSLKLSSAMNALIRFKARCVGLTPSSLIKY